MEQDSELGQKQEYQEHTTPVYFMHIPKTGGITFSHAIYPFVPMHNFHREYMYIDKIAEWALEYHKWAARIPPIFVTILRNPLDRWESQLNFCIMNTNCRSAIRNFFETSDCISDVLYKCLEKEINVNTMTKMLGGVKCNYSPTACNTPHFGKETMEGLLEAAKKNLMKFDFVGFTNSFSAFYEKVAARLGIPNEMKTQNVNKYKIFNQLDSELLHKLNEYDLKLYEFAQREISHV